VKRRPSATQTIVPRGESNREGKEFPYEKHEIPEGESALGGSAGFGRSPYFSADSSKSFIIFTSYGSGESSSAAMS
jgi:hypothetical protein